LKKLRNKIDQGEVDQLKQNIFSKDWELVKSSTNRLVEIGGLEITDFLISLLSFDSHGIRHQAALALEEIKDNRAVEPLLQAIFNKQNHNYNAIMVFALTSLDCSKRLVDIFKILFYESGEAKMYAFTILNEQKFVLKNEDIFTIDKMWKDCIKNPLKCPDYDESREDIQFIVDTYLSYLKPEQIKKKKVIEKSPKKH